MGYFNFRRVIEMAALDHPWVGEIFMRKRFVPLPETNANEWDGHYSGEVYDRLFRSDQRHHHRLLAALVAEARPCGSILEIGCGEGAFYESLRLFSPAGYVGVDFSEVGVAKASQRYQPDLSGQPQFEVGDGRSYTPAERFDAIVFPECIYYLGEPIPLLRHYAQFLKPGGVFGVSVWLNTKQQRVWQEIQAACEIIDQAVVTADWGGAWIAATFRPPRSPD